MLLYIDPAPNESGAYPNPKMQPFPGCVPLDAEQSQTFLDYNGFVTVQQIEDEETGEIGVVVTPNTEAWEAWKASLPPEPEPEPTTEERLTAIESAIERGLSL